MEYFYEIVNYKIWFRKRKALNLLEEFEELLKKTKTKSKSIPIKMVPKVSAWHAERESFSLWDNKVAHIFLSLSERCGKKLTKKPAVQDERLQGKLGQKACLAHGWTQEVGLWGPHNLGRLAQLQL